MGDFVSNETTEDFSFYSESSNEDEVKEIKGITDVVTKYVYKNMEYPCLCLNEDIVLPRSKWIVLKKFTEQGSMGDKNISLYLIRKGELLRIGGISPIQVKAVVGVVGMDNMFGFYNKNKKLEGSMLYVLSN